MDIDDSFMAELAATFVEELEDTLDSIENAFLRLEKNPDDKDVLHEIFRYFHNIKGSSKTVGFTELSQFAHIAENLLANLRDGTFQLNDHMMDALLQSADLMRAYAESVKGGAAEASDLEAHALVLGGFLAGDQTPLETKSSAPSAPSEPSGPSEPEDESFVNFSAEPEALSKPSPVDNIALQKPAPREAKAPSRPVTDETLKVPVQRINSILDLFCEQVIIQSSLDMALKEGQWDQDFIEKTLGQLKKLTQDLQHTIVTLRMVPIKGLLNRLERSVRDIARVSGKKIQFERHGQDAELDKNIVDALVDPLNHMVRNASDHGIEDSATRLKAGKNETGTVRLSAGRVGGSFEIVLEDDGKGLDAERILQKAMKLKLINESANLTQDQIHELIFHSGFSTLDKATELSGRGVGMDVVRQQLLALKGSCQIQSEKGKGTKFIIRLPLSLAMFQGTIVMVSGQRYVVPNSDFTEAISIDEKDFFNVSDSRKVVKIKDRVTRIVDLKGQLRFHPHELHRRHESEGKAGKKLAIILDYEEEHFALLVDDILSQEQIVLKRLGPEAKQFSKASGGTILGDGAVALVLDVKEVVRSVRSKTSSMAA